MLTPICISNAVRVGFPINPIATPSKSNSGATVESLYFKGHENRTTRVGYVCSRINSTVVCRGQWQYAKCTPEKYRLIRVISACNERITYFLSASGFNRVYVYISVLKRYIGKTGRNVEKRIFYSVEKTHTFITEF